MAWQAIGMPQSHDGRSPEKRTGAGERRWRGRALVRSARRRLGLAVLAAMLVAMPPGGRPLHGTGPAAPVSNSAGAQGAPVAGCAWSVEPSPNDQYESELFAVAASGPNEAWAVGRTYNLGANGHSLVEHWDGTRWRLVPSPDGPDAGAILSAVSVLSATAAWAVGTGWGPAGALPLIEQWDGHAWAIVPAPSPAPYSGFNSVAAISTTDVWAVGNSSVTLTERWDGHSWTIVPSPNPGSGGDALFGLSALGAQNLWAVGEQNSNSATPYTLVEQWTGLQWQVVPSPNPVPAGFNYLEADAAVNRHDVWATGYAYANGVGNQNLIEHGDGQRWQVVASPPVTQAQTLDGVAAAAPRDIWAVGYHGAGASLTLAEHWNGAQWSVAPSPSPGTELNMLRGVAHVPGTTQYWAVGYSGGTGSVTTLIEHYACGGGVRPGARVQPRGHGHTPATRHQVTRSRTTESDA